jgi:hypothetical protein
MISNTKDWAKLPPHENHVADNNARDELEHENPQDDFENEQFEVFGPFEDLEAQNLEQIEHSHFFPSILSKKQNKEYKRFFKKKRLVTYIELCGIGYNETASINLEQKHTHRIRSKVGIVNDKLYDNGSGLLIDPKILFQE